MDEVTSSQLRRRAADAVSARSQTLTSSPSPSFFTSALQLGPKSPYWSLLVVFFLWKGLLLAISAVATFAGPAYDTSGSLIFVDSGADPAPADSIGYVGASLRRDAGDGLVTRLTSWDAIYYVQTSRRGYIYEQEWAFGSGLPMVVALLRRVLVATSGCAGSLTKIGVVDEAVLAVIVSHAAHLLAVLLLFGLVCRLSRQLDAANASNTTEYRRTAFVAACLHILSPAGLFLSAPYGESSCALFSFAGYLTYAMAIQVASPSPQNDPTLTGDALSLLAGVSFGIATAFRSNGLLNGIVFVYEALMGCLVLLRRPSLAQIRHLAAVGLGGIAVAAGSGLPQAVAYRQFCRVSSSVPGEDVRPWCRNMPPSIYTFVQTRYWNNGLFHYWTVSNLPLFLLATPMLLVLAKSGITLWTSAGETMAASAVETGPATARTASATRTTNQTTAAATAALIRCMAVSQLLMAGLAFTSHHVQIITRVSSGYALWYAWLAKDMVVGGARGILAGRIIVFMVLYACTQGVLFASFLPPA